MAFTVTKTASGKSGTFGKHRFVVGTLTFDSSYATSGESLTAAELGLTRLDFIDIQDTVAYKIVYDKTNSKVLAYTRSSDAEVGSGVDISTTTTPFFAVGR